MLTSRLVERFRTHILRTLSIVGVLMSWAFNAADSAEQETSPPNTVMRFGIVFSIASADCH